MKQVPALVNHLSPDTVTRLERAARLRHDDGLALLESECHLSAVYLFGYSAEMCLSAAYFRAAGFSTNMIIDRDTRHQHMAQARNLETPAGEPLMNSDPHPLVGWARFLAWKRSASKLSAGDIQRLAEAVHKAEMIYKHWRPELRYKTIDVTARQLTEVRKSSEWLLEQRGRL